MAMTRDPVEVLYEEMTEAGIQAARDHKRPAQRFRASEADKCMRQIYYRLSGYRPAPRNAVGLMYGVCGDADHDLTRQMFRHYGIEVGGVKYMPDGTVDEGEILVEEFNVTLETGEDIKITVSCRPDGFISIPGFDDALLEIKGKGYWDIYWLQKEFCKGGQEAALERIKTKLRDNYWQCQVTMKLTKRDMTYLLYKDRSSGQLGLWNDETDERAGIYVAWDQEVWDQILQRWGYVRKCVDNGEVPAPEFSDGSRECKQCSFYYLCHGAEERRQRGLTPVIDYPGPKIDIHLEDRTPTPEEPNDSI